MSGILVVEDDPASLELLAFFLRSRGYEVETVTDGNRAVDMATNGDFQLIILDFHLPMYNGAEILDLVRRRHLARPVPVIALTADESADVRQALEHGRVDSFLTKPVDLTRLGLEIKRLLVA